jgi:hypothetical protein
MSASYSLNSNRWSFASGDIYLDGRRYFGLQNISPKESVKKDPVYGNGRTAIGRVRGQHSASASMDILLTEYNALLEGLGDSFTDVPFDISATFLETSGGDGVFTLGLTQVTIVEHELGLSNDGKAAIMKVTLDVVDPISWNGRRICDQGDGFDVASFGLSFSF